MSLSSEIKTKFKALIRETSVYEYYVELKQDALTSKGYLDLVKIPNLRISGAKQFFKNLRQEKKLRQIDIANYLGFQRSRIAHWENDRTIPLQSLIKIAKTCGIPKDTIYSLINQGKFSTINATLPVKFSQICDIIHYFSPQKSSVKGRITLANCSDEDLSKIKSILNVKPVVFGKIINSKELYNYLTTFFQYSEVSKIQLPLTSEVKFWYENGVDLKRAVIIPCLQTDGGIVQRDQFFVLRFHGNNKILHDYLIDAMYYEYNQMPTSYFQYYRSEDCHVTAYGRKSIKKIVDEVMKLAGNTKTKPANRQTAEEYLNEPQPHLNYLIDAPKTEQKIALRIWASAEGFVSIYKNQGGLIYLCLGISCAHPDLASQIQQISQRFNISFSKRRSKSNWSGIDSLCDSSISANIHFLKLGAFIKDVKISSHSKHHEGISKNNFLLGSLELKKRQQTNLELRNLSNKELHCEINKIIENKEYKTAAYYIDYFTG